MTLLRKSDETELMDSPAVTGEELLRALRFLAWVNQSFGGYGAVLGRFEEWSKAWEPGAAVSVLDFGTGWADLPNALLAWARRRGFCLKIAAIDSAPAAAALARENAPEVEVLEAELEAFAKGGRRFDYVISSLCLHHIPRPRQVPALKACDAMAVRGVLFSDLRRSIPAYLAVTATTAVFGDRLTRHDGPLSVRRAFTPQELSDLAREAGLEYLEARSHPFFRLTLSGEKRG